MVKEIAKHLYCIEVPLPNNPLRAVNSYFIRGDERDLLIDTGFRCEDCYQALEAGLQELCSDRARRDVLTTHLHSDHSGMADLFVGEGGHIYMGATECTYMCQIEELALRDDQNERMVAEGFPRDLVEYNARSNPAYTMTLPSTTPLCPLQDGEVLQVGDYRLETIEVPGHTPGQCIFWCEKQGILFTGDHVLFDITPNITAWPLMDDALGDYLNSLRKVRDFPVQQALPSHRLPGDFHARIDSLLKHHEIRIQSALDIVTANPGLSAYEIAGFMTWQIRSASWEDFPTVQKFFAVGECLSHLDYLYARKSIQRTLHKGVYRYSKV